MKLILIYLFLVFSVFNLNAQTDLRVFGSTGLSYFNYVYPPFDIPLNKGYYFEFGLGLNYNIKHKINLIPNISTEFYHHPDSVINASAGKIYFLFHYMNMGFDFNYEFNKIFVGVGYSGKFLITKTINFADGRSENGLALIRPADYSDRWQNELKLIIGYYLGRAGISLEYKRIIDNIFDNKNTESPYPHRYLEHQGIGLKAYWKLHCR